MMAHRSFICSREAEQSIDEWVLFEVLFFVVGKRKIDDPCLHPVMHVMKAGKSEKFVLRLDDSFAYNRRLMILTG